MASRDGERGSPVAVGPARRSRSGDPSEGGTMKRIVVIAAAMLAVSLVVATQALAQNRPSRYEPCVRGMAGEFPCHKVDLLHYFTMEEIGGGRGSDVWGWEDPATGRDYVLAGGGSGAPFLRVTSPKRPAAP